MLRPLEEERANGRSRERVEDARPAGKQNVGRIEELRDRQRKLLDEGEAWNESGRFRIAREIFDLEHAEPTPSDEWPDWIPG